MTRAKIKVMVVDDSALMRKMIPVMLHKSTGIEVVATAMDGKFALAKAEKYRPDVITLDLDMPGMDGLTTLRHIVSDFSIPVVVVSSMTANGAELAMKAFDLGAIEIVSKPSHTADQNIKDMAEELISKVVFASHGSLSKLHIGPAAEPEQPDSPRPGQHKPAEKVVAIGVSTGGPNALTYLLPLLSPDLPAAVLIVQHMPPGFTGVFASRLNRLCRMDVKEVEDNDPLVPGKIYIAPGDAHIKIEKTSLGPAVVLSRQPPENGHRPSIDVLFRSVASEFGPGATGVIMTGMGDDGAEGIGHIRKSGGRTLAQNEKSSVVFGMARAAISRGYIEQVVSLEDMADAITCAVDPDKGAIAANHV